MTESSNGEVRYLLSDGLGSVVGYNEFDPYGVPVNNNGGDPYGYTGEWYGGYMHLLHLRARWYAPETGTFLSVDPVESEPPYQYVRGNVVNLTDPSGNSPECQDGCKPVAQPDDMHEKARISCFDLRKMGGSNPMEEYLKTESDNDPAALLTRIAVSENTNNPGDQKLVMWIIRYRMAVAHSAKGGDSEAKKYGPTDLWTEVSEGGFEPFDMFRYINEPEKAAGSKDIEYNVKAGFYPNDTKLDDDGKSVKGWIAAYSEAQSVLVADLKTGFPQRLIVNKEIENGIVEDSVNKFKYAFDAFTCNRCSVYGNRFSRPGFSGGNRYYAWNPQRSQWIWPEWTKKGTNGK